MVNALIQEWLNNDNIELFVKRESKNIEGYE
jgi:hypothetical protein